MRARERHFRRLEIARERGQVSDWIMRIMEDYKLISGAHVTDYLHASLRAISRTNAHHHTKNSDNKNNGNNNNSSSNRNDSRDSMDKEREKRAEGDSKREREGNEESSYQEERIRSIYG